MPDLQGLVSRGQLLPREGLAPHATVQTSVLLRKADIEMSVAMSAFDAVDGAHSTASMCQRVVALKRTTMRGAVHG